MFSKTVVTRELYERLLSIRYCYPRLLQSKLKHSIVDKEERKSLVNQLPSELWLRILKLLHEQDMQHLTFAFPQFQLLKILWDAEETKDFVTDPSRPKYLPTISTQYGSRTLFSFSDSDFFYLHIDGCCRVAAVYAFFLLGHGKDSTTYIVRYDRNTHELCEVQMEKILADAFYNRNCYGSLYRVEQKDKKKRQPTVDLDHSVDRTYLTNQQQSQLIGQDLLSRFHFETRDLHSTKSDIFGFGDEEDSETDDDEQLGTRSTSRYKRFGRRRTRSYEQLDKSDIRIYERQHALFDRKNKLVDHGIGSDDDLDCPKDPAISYCEHLMKQDSGTSLFRMVSATDHFMDLVRRCRRSKCRFGKVRNLIRHYNHLVFDFNKHHLTVERLSDEESSCADDDSLLHDCVRILQRSVPSENPISYYRVNIEQLAKETKGFNHASLQTSFPAVNIDRFSFLDYTHLSHVPVAQNSDQVFVLATYGGITAL